MVRATGVLRREHQSIREALNFAEGVSVKMEGGEQSPPEVLAKVMDFFRLYVDRCHHGKEEEVLFPLLEKKGMSTSSGPLGVMLMEHDQARALIQEMSEAAEAYKADGESAGARWARAAWDYSGLMQEHFGKEEDLLFRMADNVLGPEDEEAIAAGFKQVEKEKIGPEKHEELEATMRDLIARNGGR
ncbi:MAG: hemerythrin domain-containing protein [Terriglobia bacterium]